MVPGTDPTGAVRERRNDRQAHTQTHRHSVLAWALSVFITVVYRQAGLSHAYQSVGRQRWIKEEKSLQSSSLKAVNIWVGEELGWTFSVYTVDTCTQIRRERSAMTLWVHHSGFPPLSPASTRTHILKVIPLPNITILETGHSTHEP